MPKPSNRHRNRSKNPNNTSTDLSTSSHPDNKPADVVECPIGGGGSSEPAVCLDRRHYQSLSIEATTTAAGTLLAADKVDSAGQDAPLSPQYNKIPSSGTRTVAPETAEEKQLSQAAAVEQSLSEMVLVTTNKPNSEKQPQRQSPARESVSSSVWPPTDDQSGGADRMFMPTTTTGGGGGGGAAAASTGGPTTGSAGHTIEDPFARERQKRLLPSNTVSLGAGSFEGRSNELQCSLPVHLPPHQEEMCHTLIRDLNKYGVCVLDEFLGEQRGQKVLSEVVTMYSAGKFKDGQLAQPSTKPGEIRDQKHIRGDKITWIGGREPGCSNIGYLINQVSERVTMTMMISFSFSVIISLRSHAQTLQQRERRSG